MEKVAIVTGASRGIGREITITLAKHGIKVIANYNKSEKEILQLKEQLEKEAKKIVNYTLQKYNKIDILINNAGISEYKLFTDETDEDWDRVVNTNLYSAFVMCQEVVPSMIHRKCGCIINISSVWGIVGGALEVIYSISKAGLDGLTKALAKELGPSNIRVNSIAPGLINTDMNKNLTENDIEQLKDEIPLGKIGKTSDISKCVKWLVEDEFTTGQIFSINGGWVIT